MYTVGVIDYSSEGRTAWDFGGARICVWDDPDPSDHPSGVQRPCECGCSNGDWVGYIMFTDGNKAGLTLFLEDERTYQEFRERFGGER